jgi:2,3-bisphosphoglycerate-independent phosphoglycerate mutase
MALLPVVVILLDGVGDRAHGVLGGRTAAEAATTPNLDALAARGSNGVMLPLGPGRAPASEVAHWALLGYLPDEFPGRAVLEAVGRGQEVSAGDVFAYAALRPAERRVDGHLWLTGRPDPGDADDARLLVQACDGLVEDGLEFALADVGRGEAILRVRIWAASGPGDAVPDERLTDTDVFFRDRHPVLRPLACASEAERAAAAVEAWTRRTIDLLSRHPVNASRRAAGLRELNVVTLKWWGRPRPVPTFEQRHGLRGSFGASSAFLRGLARTLGLAAIDLPETGDVTADLVARVRFARARLEAGDTFVFVHTKAVDEAGHTKDPLRKRDTIEAVDTALGDVPVECAVVCVTGDHATPASSEVIHSGDPVPLVVAGPGVRADGVVSFGELDSAAGILGHLCGADLMPVLLNAADRALFAGSRPTPFRHAQGYPSLLEPL